MTNPAATAAPPRLAPHGSSRRRPQNRRRSESHPDQDPDHRPRLPVIPGRAEVPSARLPQSPARAVPCTGQPRNRKRRLPIDWFATSRRTPRRHQRTGWKAESCPPAMIAEISSSRLEREKPADAAEVKTHIARDPDEPAAVRILYVFEIGLETPVTVTDLAVLGPCRADQDHPIVWIRHQTEEPLISTQLVGLLLGTRKIGLPRVVSYISRGSGRP